jgi:PAS domain S-box-containing protein
MVSLGTNQGGGAGAVSETREWTRALLEATADGILVVDRRGGIVFANQRFRALWQLGPETVDAGEEAIISAMLPQVEDPSGFRAALLDHQAAPERESKDMVRLRDGRVFERQALPQRFAGQIVGRVWTYRDVSERERLLRRTQLLADATRLLASLDVEGALRGLAELTVRSFADACAIDLFEDGSPRRIVSLARDTRRRFAPELRQAVLTDQPTRYELGDVAYLRVPFPSKTGRVGAMTVVAPQRRRFLDEDVEVLQELGRRAGLSVENAALYRGAQEAVAVREEFLSIASHEIRGPIAALHLATQMLRRGHVASQAQDRAFDIIEREDRRLAHFVDELLDVSRIRSGGFRFDFEPVDLGDVVRGVVARLEPDLERSGSTVSLRIEGTVRGEWDAFRLDQVITNLLSNAIKFGLGQPIDVRVSSFDDRARLVVQDHGIGIAPEARERIFTPFGRGVSARHHGGLGLGLYIVKTIVDGMGGLVRLESAAGGGTRFSVELPKHRGPR